jgi:hypothetical protein
MGTDFFMRVIGLMLSALSGFLLSILINNYIYHFNLS